MPRIFTLSTLAVLTAAAFSAQPQITVDGMLSAAEAGTGTGKYQLVRVQAGSQVTSQRVMVN